MFLTPEQQAILDGAQGETMAKVMQTLVMYGEAFGADKMVPVTSDYNHLVTSFGLQCKRFYIHRLASTALQCVQSTKHKDMQATRILSG